MPKEKVRCKSISIIMLGSVVKVKKKYYPQTLLEECKYEPTKIKMENRIDDDLEKSSSMTQIMKLTMVLMMKRDLTMIMMNPVKNLLKVKTYFNNNESLIVYVNHVLLGFYLC